VGLLVIRSSVVAAEDPYTTTFSATENPISEGGLWTQGGTVGGASWQNMLSEGGSPGTAYGAGPTAAYEDCIAAVQGVFSPTQHFVEITIRKDGGYSPGGAHEVEAHVGCTISANSVQTYEVLFPIGGGILLVRWNGPSESFDLEALGVTSGSLSHNADDGDVWRIEFDSTSGSPIITGKENGVTRFVATDTSVGKITSGSPGIAAFARADGALDMKKFAIKGVTMGSL
jgi:hypothetical protein